MRIMGYIIMLLSMTAFSSENVELLGKGLWGHNNTAHRHDSLFIASGGGRISIFSFDEEDRPFEKSHVYARGIIRDIDTHSNRLFSVTKGYAQMFDIMDTEFIRPVSSINLDFSSYYSYELLALSPSASFDTDSILFVGGTYRRLFSVSFADTLEPELLQTFSIGAVIYDIDTDEQYAYLACGSAGLKIVDIGDPEDMTLVSTSPAVSDFRGVLVDGDLCYVTDYYNGLLIYDVSSRESPVGRGALDTPGFATGFDKVDEYIYLADYFSGMRIIDVSNPFLPYETGFEDHLGTVVDIAVIDTIALMANSSLNPQFVRIEDSISLGIFQEYPMPRGGLDAIFHDGFIVAAARSYGICVMTRPDSGDAHLFYTLDTPGTTRKLFSMENLIFAADGSGGMRIIEIDSYGGVGERGSLDTPGSARAIFAKDSLAYIADAGSGLHIVDITELASPMIVATYPTDNAYAIEVRDTIAYIGDGLSGLKILSIANFDSIYLLGEYNAHPAVDIAIRDGLAFIAADNEGLVILDVNNPSDILLVSAYEFGFYIVNGIHLQDDLCFLSCDNRGLSIVDVSDIVNPWRIGWYTSEGSAMGVYADSTSIVLATEDNGIHILRYTPPQPLRFITDIHLYPDTVAERSQSILLSEPIKFWNTDTIPLFIGLSTNCPCWQPVASVPDYSLVFPDTTLFNEYYNTYSISAIFSDTEPETTLFSDTLNSLRENIIWTGGLRIEGLDSLMPSDTASLWLRIGTPPYYSTQSCSISVDIHFRKESVY